MKLNVLVLFAMIIPTKTLNAAYLDASNLAEALTMIAVNIEVVEETRKYCNKEIPKQRPYFDHYA